MFPEISHSLDVKSFDYQNIPLIKPTGFREYDARWWYGHPGSDKPPEINLLGIQLLGLGIGTYIGGLYKKPKIVIGHDYRSYSQTIKMALLTGLLATGCEVHDIGLALSPSAYYAQFHLDIPCVAMVTASHNDNGWTGVKMGAQRPVTFGPDEINALRNIVYSQKFSLKTGGQYIYHQNFSEHYIHALCKSTNIKRDMRAVVACGNGTAGAFAPDFLRKIGVDVIELDATADYDFPNYNPNPEDMGMLHAVREKVLKENADIGFAFDGDGDRCGVVDNKGREIFADKIGVIIARELAKTNPNAKFIADVKSTGLFVSDPVLKDHQAKCEYWKTGHSYIKRRVSETGALAGFEKSGHFFFNSPIGNGYDDGLLTARVICELLDNVPNKTMADLHDDLPKSWGSPTMSAKCDDEIKYDVVDRVKTKFETMFHDGSMFAGQQIKGLITVNGVRAQLEDGSWGLVRASSNKPEIVVVVESPTSEENMRAVFKETDGILRQNPEVGAYNQTI